MVKRLAASKFRHLRKIRVLIVAETFLSPDRTLNFSRDS
jgi:hypothetical protein